MVVPAVTKFPLMFRLPGPVAAVAFPKAKDPDAVAYPEKLTLPVTSNLAAGEVVPIPTLPEKIAFPGPAGALL